MKYPLCFNFLVGEKRVAPLVSAKGVSLFVTPLSFPACAEVLKKVASNLSRPRAAGALASNCERSRIALLERKFYEAR